MQRTCNRGLAAKDSTLVLLGTQLLQFAEAILLFVLHNRLNNLKNGKEPSKTIQASVEDNFARVI